MTDNLNASTQAPSTVQQDNDAFRAATAGIRAFVLATASVDRNDRLWPADGSIFETNPVNLAYGASGIGLFLDKTGGLPDYVVPWIVKQAETVQLPTGLYTGAAGMAVALAALGHASDAAVTLLKYRDAPQKLAEPNLFQGAAGWGLACLSLYDSTGSPALLAEAIAVGQHLLRTAHRGETGELSWPKLDGTTLLGLAYGASGIALFLTALGAATQREEYTEAARRALAFELSQAETSNGWLRWGTEAGAAGTSPYWVHGTAGVGIALLRFAIATDSAEHLDAADRAAHGCRGLFAGFPGNFQGMSGIGQFLLDTYLETNDETHLHRAREYGKSILCFAIEREEGVAFPGHGFARLSNDYGTGAAGVGLFFHRLLHLTPRSLIDLP